VYNVLTTRCGVSVGKNVLEIGPGTGRVTRRLLELGARVVGVEPDASLVAHLRENIDQPAFEVVHGSFEEASLPDRGFDCVAAAMSFHWVDQQVGLPKLGNVLRPGGWAASWWTVFGDPTRSDPFHDAVEHMLPQSAGPARQVTTSFELDADRRERDLVELAGLEEVHAEFVPWTTRMTAAETRALYASMIAVLRLPPAERHRLLETITATVDKRFGGVVTRPFVTVLYTGRRPAG
jgi:SAM-dependent methyltransferase